MSDFRSLLTGAPSEGREVLARLFGGQRIRVSPHAERGFALEGVAVLDLMQVVRGAGDTARPYKSTPLALPLAA